MKQIRYLLLLVFQASLLAANAQDTISVYFDFGISKIKENQYEVLNNLRAKYDLTEVDSIYYIGMADSVGDIQSNIKLSEKRAKNVAKYNEDLFPKNTPYSIFSKGEELGSKVENNRRVDIILFVTPTITFTENVDTVIVSTDENMCYKVDYYILHRSSIHTIIKSKKEYVIIETNEVEWLNINKHYYGILNNSGNF